MITQIIQLHLLLLVTKLKKQYSTYIFKYHDVSLQGSAAAYLMEQQCDFGTTRKYWQA